MKKTQRHKSQTRDIMLLLFFFLLPILSNLSKDPIPFSNLFWIQGLIVSLFLIIVQLILTSYFLSFKSLLGSRIFSFRSLILTLLTVLVLVGISHLLFQPFMPHTQNHSPLLATLAIIVASGNEEIFFRSYLPLRIRNIFSLNSLFAYGLSSLIFSLSHANQGITSVIFSLIAAIILSLLRTSTQSLAPCLIAHISYNLLRLFVFV